MRASCWAPSRRTPALPSAPLTVEDGFKISRGAVPRLKKKTYTFTPASTARRPKRRSELRTSADRFRLLRRDDKVVFQSVTRGPAAGRQNRQVGETACLSVSRGHLGVNVLASPRGSANGEPVRLDSKKMPPESETW